MLRINGRQTMLLSGDILQATFDGAEVIGIKISRGSEEIVETRKDSVLSTIYDVDSFFSAVKALCDQYDLSYSVGDSYVVFTEKT